MKAGVSTACLYPMVLEKAFQSLAETGVRTTEIFVNSHCELSGTYKSEMLAMQKEYGIDVVSVHPFTCGIEPMMLFTALSGRIFMRLLLTECTLQILTDLRKRWMNCDWINVPRM